MKLSIVIPCYNEENGIEPLVLELKKLQLPPGAVEWIFVQNGSKDQTEEKLRQYTASLPDASIVEVPVNQGYGYGIKQGLKAARGDYLGWIHADLQFSPMEIQRAYDTLGRMNEPHCVLLKGLRKNRPIVDRMFTIGMACYETLLLKQGLRDINAQPCIFSRDLYEKWNELAPDDFSLDLYAYYLAKREKARIVRWPVQQSERKAGVSKWNTGMKARWIVIQRTMAFSRELKRRFRQ